MQLLEAAANNQRSEIKVWFKIKAKHETQGIRLLMLVMANEENITFSNPLCFAATKPPTKLKVSRADHM